MKLLGISGKAKAGKDTTADYLIEQGYYIKKGSFAAGLKKLCSSYFDIPLDCFYDQTKKETKFEHPIAITALDALNLIRTAIKTGAYKEPDLVFPLLVNTPRQLLQVVGTDILRRSNDSCHLILFNATYPTKEGLVVTDVRFENEANYILRNDGLLIRIKGRTCSFESRHLSELALDNWDKWDYILNNSRRGKHYLYAEIDKMLSFFDIS